MKSIETKLKSIESKLKSFLKFDWPKKNVEGGAKKSASYRVSSNCLGWGGPHTNQMQTLYKIFVQGLALSEASPQVACQGYLLKRSLSKSKLSVQALYMAIS